MAAGRLRHKIRFDRRVIVDDDGAGNVQQDWQPIFGPVAAEIKPLRGGEEVLASRLAGVAIVEILIRSSYDSRRILPTDRAYNIRDGTQYNLHLIENRDMKNEYLTITAEIGGAIG